MHFARPRAIAEGFDRFKAEVDAGVDDFGLMLATRITSGRADAWDDVKLGITADVFSLTRVGLHVIAGALDTLRLGDGMAAGGVDGWGTDARRLVAIVPWGRAFKLVRLSSTSVRFVDILPGTGVCMWVSAAQALRRTGARAFAVLSDLARVFGVPVPEMGGILAENVVPFPEKLGATAEAVAARDVARVVKLAERNPGAVVLLQVKWFAREDVVSSRHAMMAYKPMFGPVRLMDRAGMAVTSLAELEALRAGVFEWTGLKDAVAYGRPVLVRGAQALNGIGLIPSVLYRLALQMTHVPTPPPDTPTGGTPAVAVARPARRGGIPVVSAALPAARTAAASTAPPPRTAQTRLVCPPIPNSDTPLAGNACVPVREYRVRDGDTLSKIASSFYRDPNRWTTIYEAKKAALGRNPFLVEPGQVLRIP